MAFKRSVGNVWKALPATAIVFFLFSALIPKLTAQDRYGDRDRERITRIEPGTMIAVKNNESIDVEQKSNQVYDGIVDQDVRGGNGRLAIPRGSKAEMIVRVTPDNDLVIDVESVVVDGQRYAIKTEKTRQESARDNGLVGAIVGAIQGGEARGRAVRIPRDSVLTFRIRRPLVMGVADEGVDRDGRHYHDYYDNR
jgi:hypothetical protein